MAAVEARTEPLAAARGFDQLGELAEVPAERALGAGGVLEQDRAARCPSSASAIALPARFTDGPIGLTLAGAGVEHDAIGPDPVADPQRVLEGRR